MADEKTPNLNLGLVPDDGGNMTVGDYWRMMAGQKDSNMAKIDTAVAGKQEKLTGKEGQILSFGPDGAVKAVNAAEITGNAVYGVSGVGGSAPALVRTGDAVGLVANMGTDSETPKNDFDNIAPFNRRKCVGVWSQPDEQGLAHFTPKAYLGDPDFKMDGSMGDYCAIEVEPLWYKQDLETGEIAVSAKPMFGDGWRIHPICVDEHGQIRYRTYGPCYDLCVDGENHAVCLPGYSPSYGSYKSLTDICKTYGGGNTAAMLTPDAWWHYNWLLSTIEMATQNAQNVMYGAASMRYADDKVTVGDGSTANSVVVTAAIGNNFVVGQTIYIGPSYSETKATSTHNTVTKIENCTEDGMVQDGGTYRKITFDGTARAITAGTTTISSRPWKTGTCDTVQTPSGSPTSNTTGKYPMRYRYLENFYGNIYKTMGDLFCCLEDGKIKWYKLTDYGYTPAAATNPTLAEMQGDQFAHLAPTSPNVSGYIKKFVADPAHPEILIPTETTGASTTTYTCDYAYLLNGEVKERSVRRGGYVSAGLYAGPCYCHAHLAPSFSFWNCGGGLFFRQ